MAAKDVLYKHGAWRIEGANKSIFNKDKLILSLVEKLKRDIENNDPSDKVAQKHVSDLLYHYCWKMADVGNS